MAASQEGGDVAADVSEGPTGAADVAPAPAPTDNARASPTVPNKLKKKRGRPRKYGPNGGLLRPPPPLKATPISTAAADEAVPYTPAAAVGAAMKRAGVVRPSVGFVSRPAQQFGFGSNSSGTDTITTGVKDLVSGEMLSCAAGANFTPHIITVAPGEDVTMKVISFSQQGPRAICVLSANGVVSNVTLRQPDSLGGTLTYEGRFELLSLSGSFMPTENGGVRGRSGGMSVSLAGPDGRVIGGGVAGLLIASSPVQVVVGSFVPSYQIEQNANKPRVVVVEATQLTTPTVPFTITKGDAEESYSGEPVRCNSATPKVGVSVSTTLPFRVENWASSDSMKS